MANADSTLDILIRLGVIGKDDAKAVEDLLKQTGTAAVGAGEAGKEMGGKLTDAGEEGKHAAHGLFESHREVHKLIHAIGTDAVPGMGSAFAALAHGPLGALIAVGMAVEFLKKSIEETNNRLDEMSRNASKAFGGTDYITQYATAAAQAASDTDNLADAMRKASSAGDTVKTKYEAEAKAIKDVVAALTAKLKAQEEADLIEARSAAKRSGASPEVARAVEEQIRARYASRGDAAQDAADQALQHARQRELEEREKNKQPLVDAATAKETPIPVSVSRAARAAELQAQEAALAKATSEQNTAANDEIKEKVENNKELLEDSRKRYGNSDPVGLMKTMQDETDRLESETAEARAEAAKKKIEQLSEQVIKDTHNADEEKSAREEATNTAVENAKRIVELQKEIAAANTAAKTKTESIAELVRSLKPGADPKTFEKMAGVDTDAGAAAFIQKFLEAQSRLTQHRGTKDDSQMVELLNGVLQTTQQTDKRVFLLLKDLIAHKGDVNGALKDLSRQLRDVAHQTSRPNF